MKTYSVQTSLLSILLFVLTCSLSGCYTNSNHPKNHAILEAESLLWTAPDSSKAILAAIDQDSLPYSEQMYWYLLHEHANLKLQKSISPDSIMTTVIAYFVQTNNFHYLGEAYYVQGVEYSVLRQYKEAIQSLKQAERMIAHMDTIEPYIGMIYYKLGEIHEKEQLYNIAAEYYQKAVPYFEACHSHHYLAFCYRDISRTAHCANTTESQKIEETYRKALAEATISNNIPLKYDIMLHHELNRLPLDSVRIFQLSQYMCDSLGLCRQAFFVAEHYLERGDIELGTKYLHMFANDTINSDWGKIQYHYLACLLMKQKGDLPMAFHSLQQVYHDLWILLQHDVEARTYSISKYYDLEREQELRLQLQIDKQKLIIATCGIATLLLIGSLVALLIIMQQRNEKRALQQRNEVERLSMQAKALEAHAKQMEAQNKIDQLQTELKVRRSALRQGLQYRIDLTKRLHQMPERERTALPESILKYINSITFSDKNTWDTFLHEFNDLYDNILSRIKDTYPNITDKDLQYIALSVMKMHNSDICFLLDTTERTIWNRRQRIKNHIGNANIDIDKWIAALVH